MDTELRQSYLSSFTPPYELPQKVWSPRQLKKQLGRVVGGEKPKSDTFHVAGVIEVVGEFTAQDSEGMGPSSGSSGANELKETYPLLRLSGEDESFGIAFPIVDKLVKTYNGLAPLDVLKSGDHVLISSNWESIRLTGGLMPDISHVVPLDIKLCAPNSGDSIQPIWGFQRGKQWEYFQTLIRKCFAFLEFTEARTPTLVESPGLEPFISPFETELNIGSMSKTYFLNTSPEIHLKKLLSLGWYRVFEMKSCFRNDESTEHHEPEFLMLEWYRSYASLEAIQKDLQGLLNYLKLHWPDSINGFEPIKTKSMSELFNELVGIELTPNLKLEDYKSFANKLGLETRNSDEIDDVFFRIFTERVEPELKKVGPIIVNKFPPFLSALARIDAEGWADRFEFYWKGLEIANAYFEVTCPEEQLERYKQENKKRQRLGKREIPIDDEFIAALRSGVPPSAGIALGVDRLFMAVCDLSEIGKSRAFPIKKGT